MITSLRQSCSGWLHAACVLARKLSLLTATQVPVSIALARASSPNPRIHRSSCTKYIKFCLLNRSSEVARQVLLSRIARAFDAIGVIGVLACTPTSTVAKSTDALRTDERGFGSITECFCVAGGTRCHAHILPGWLAVLGICPPLRNEYGCRRLRPAYSESNGQDVGLTCRKAAKSKLQQTLLQARIEIR